MLQITTWYVLFVVITILSIHHSWLITGFITRVNIPHVLSSAPCFSVVHGAQAVVTRVNIPHVLSSAPCFSVVHGAQSVVTQVNIPHVLSSASCFSVVHGAQAVVTRVKIPHVLSSVPCFSVVHGAQAVEFCQLLFLFFFPFLLFTILLSSFCSRFLITLWFLQTFLMVEDFSDVHSISNKA